MTKEEILEKLKRDTIIRGLSKNTQDEYYTKAKLFQDYYDKPATELDINDIKNFLYYLLAEKGLAPGSINTYNSGLSFCLCSFTHTDLSFYSSHDLNL